MPQPLKGLRDKKYAYGAKSIAPSDLGKDSDLLSEINIQRFLS
jgi:hypothetical protein